MPTTCEIEFKNDPDKVIYAGQLLRGVVFLTLTEMKRVRAVYIRISRKAETSWNGPDPKSSYRGEQISVIQESYLVDGRNGIFFVLDFNVSIQ